jgi:hypothetical protein
MVSVVVVLRRIEVFNIKNIAIIFLSIFFEALPFLLLGSIISSIIEKYVSNEKIASIIPKNPILGSLFGIFLGFFLPACDCAVIPITKRLIKKKVPINVAVSFMLASPIINPVVLLSTYYAFYSTNPKIFWARFILGILVAVVVSSILGLIFKNDFVVKNSIEEIEEECSCCHHHHENAFLEIVNHTMSDLFDVLKYMIFGALIASFVQVYMPRSVITVFNSNNYLSIIVLMLFAYLLSLCSTSDSFIGKSLINSFTKSSVVAYLLLGPMIDVKNTIVLVGNFKKKFVLYLIVLIFVVVFIISSLVVGIV